MYFLVLILITVAMESWAVPSAQVDLAVAKKFAIENSFEVKSLQRALEERKALVGQRRSALFPTIGFAGGGEQNPAGVASTTGILAYGYAEMNLFRGFQDSYEIDIAEIEAEIAAIRLKQAKFRVGLTLEEYFHKYHLQKVSIELLEEAIKANTVHRGMAASRASAGMAAISDIMEFEMKEALLKSDLEFLKQEIEEVRIRLRKLLGDEIGSTIEPLGALQHQHIEGSLMDYINRMTQECEAIRIASREVAKANIEARLWKSTWLPTVDLQAQVGYLNLDVRPSGGGPGFRGTVVAKFDLFQGFRSSHIQNENEAKQLRTELEMKNAMQTAINDTEVAFRRLITIQKRVDLEEKNTVRAERYYKSVLSEYRRGVKNSADVKSAADSLLETKLRQEKFKHDFLEERIALERSMGGPIATVTIKE